jgi:F-type H+-transporting ATPase subunit epsilon
MATESRFHLSVVTPEKSAWEGEVRFVAVPAHDGEIGFLAHRAPLVAKLTAGALRIETADGKQEALFVDGGFAEMLGDRLTVLTQTALPVEELDAADAEQHLAAARALPSVDDAEYAERQSALHRAREEQRLTRG